MKSWHSGRPLALPLVAGTWQAAESCHRDWMKGAWGGDWMVSPPTPLWKPTEGIRAEGRGHRGVALVPGSFLFHSFPLPRVP